MFKRQNAKGQKSSGVALLIVCGKQLFSVYPPFEPYNPANVRFGSGAEIPGRVLKGLLWDRKQTVSLLVHTLEPVFDPLESIVDRFGHRSRLRRRAADEDDFDADFGGSEDLGRRSVAPGMLGDQRVDVVIGQNGAFVFDRIRRRAGDQFQVRQATRSRYRPV